jgi:hypothetical protein
MSTFLVRFHRTSGETFCGEVRHVSTGETIRFARAAQLVEFFEAMNAVSMSRADTGKVRSPAAPDPARVKDSNAQRPGARGPRSGPAGTSRRGNG